MKQSSEDDEKVLGKAEILGRENLGGGPIPG